MEGQVVGDAWTSESAMGAITVAGQADWAKALLRAGTTSQSGKVSLGPRSRGICRQVSVCCLLRVRAESVSVRVSLPTGQE